MKFIVNSHIPEGLPLGSNKAIYVSSSISLGFHICWNPGHIGIKGNEKVDRAAKAALDLEVDDVSLL